MAIVEMSKLKLIGISYERERILNALHRTGAVELRETEEIEDTRFFANAELKERLTKDYDRLNRAISFLEEQLARAKKSEFYPRDLEGAKDGFDVAYDEFMSAPGNEVELFYVVSKTEEYTERLLNNKANRIRYSNLLSQLSPFLGMKERFCDFRDTLSTKCFFGTLPLENLASLQSFLETFPAGEFDVLAEDRAAVVSVICMKADADSVSAKMNELGFSVCPFREEATPSDLKKAYEKEIAECEVFEWEITKKACYRAANLRNMKILADFYRFQLEKLKACEQFRCTASAFVLEGYLPKERETDVKNALYGISNAIFLEFSQPTEEDEPPTLLKNNPVIRSAEFVTNMYSVPNYREIDPNKLVFFFYMVFFGLIMADIGYGLILFAAGLTAQLAIKKDTGFKKLMGVILYGGLFTILFGVIFGSFFGVALPFQILPSPVPDNTDREMSTANMMLILLFCLGLGVLHIMAGYLIKAFNSFRKGKIADGIFDALTWVLFFIGMIFAVFSFLMDYFKIYQNSSVVFSDGLKRFFQIMQLPGIIMLVAALLLAMVTAGRKERGFGKFSKGFGALYGVINLMSDVLSYARLFGLLLSGMIVGSIFNDMGADLIGGGGFGYVFGPLVILIGQAFNLAMGALGAYIHDSRLQYIEFFSKFYDGEGRLFAPLGSQMEYINLTK